MLSETSSEKRIVLIMIALAITCGFFLLVLLSFPLVYGGNDDASIQYVLSGVITGQPYPLHPFINAALSAVICGLYRLAPIVPWWYVWLTALAFSGVLFVVYYYIKKCVQKRISTSIWMMTLTVYLFGIVLFAISRYNFSVVPALFSGGIIAAVMSETTFRERRQFVRLIILICVGYCLVFLTRWESGVASAGYLVLAFLYVVNKSEKNRMHQIRYGAALLILLLVESGLFYGINTLTQENWNGEYYIRFNRARSNYLDYPHPDYSMDPSSYENEDWNETIASMVSYWCFMDERVDAESLEKLSGDRTIDIKTAFSSVHQAMSDREIVMIVLTWFASLAAWIMAGLTHKKPKNLIFGLLNLFGTLFLSFMILTSGRVIYRAFAPFLIPSAVLFLFLAVEEAESAKDRQIRVSKLAFAAFMVIVVTMSCRLCFDQSWEAGAHTNKERESLINNYAMEHSQDVFVADLEYSLLQMDPLKTYPKDKPSNIISWGNCLTHSDAFLKQLHINGLEKLDGASLSNSNVHFLSSIDLEQRSKINPLGRMGAFYQWMSDNYGAIGLARKDVICKDFCVYDFVYSDTAERFSSYYIFSDTWEPILISTEKES